MTSSYEYRRVLAADQFHRARRQAALERLIARLSGQSADLLSYGEVAEQLGVSGQSPRGTRQIPLDHIVGSVGRYHDFSRTFLPRLESDEDRWISVGAAAVSVGDLPPIDVYQIGDSYFVLDGNHRVSIARRQRLTHIDARVTEVRTRVPLPPGAKPDDLIVAAEYRAFLQATQLDLARADVDLRVSVPGQYVHLENAIEAHRYRLETDGTQELSFEEAAARWYDEAYLPIVLAMRQEGILRYFPGRTETDLFAWLARHRAELENALGHAVSPEVAVARLLPRVQASEQAAVPRPSPLRRLAQRVAPDRPTPPDSWAAERTLSRYAGRLFANVLALVTAEDDLIPVVRRAARVSRMEGAALIVLVSEPAGEEPVLAPAATALLAEERAAGDLSAEVSPVSGDVTQPAQELAFLSDLIVLSRACAPTAGEPSPSAAACRILTHVSRPILFAGSPDRPPPRHALLVHDTRRKFDEAVFLAAYVAELWGIRLTGLPISNGRNTAGHVARTRDYLALHEVTAAFLEPARATTTLPERILDAANEAEVDLIIMPGPGVGHGNKRHGRLDETILTILRNWPEAVLVAC